MSTTVASLRHWASTFVYKTTWYIELPSQVCWRCSHSQNSSTPVELEMTNVTDWPRENKMSTNLLKTVELVFRRPNVSGELLAHALPDMNRVCDAKLLGIYFRHDFNFSKHVESVVAICNQRLFLSAQLKKQGLRVHALNSVYNAIVLNKTLYALSVCFSYLTEGHKDTLRRVLKRANRMGFTFHGYDFDQLNETSQDKLFRCCRSERHCLHHLLTVESSPPAAMHHRQRGHDFVLPNIKKDFN